MNFRIRTTIYYLSQLLILVVAIATGSPARAENSSLQPAPANSTKPTLAIVETKHAGRRVRLT